MQPATHVNKWHRFSTHGKKSKHKPIILPCSFRKIAIIIDNLADFEYIDSIELLADTAILELQRLRIIKRETQNCASLFKCKLVV